MKKIKRWRPDPKYSDLLRRFFDMGLSAYTAHQQKPPLGNKYGITKMPDYKTVQKYWRFWKDEHEKEHMEELSKTQREVKAQFSISYDKQIMIAESQIQEFLKYKEENYTKFLKEQNKQIESSREKKTLDPFKPDIQLELALAKLNELQGDMKMAKAALLAAPLVNQLSEEAVIENLERENEKLAKEARVIKRGKKNSR